VRVLDFEVAALPSSWRCDDGHTNSSDTCVEHVRVSGRCFSGCPFIVSHGTVQQSIGLVQGYTFPEALFAAVADFVAERPNEIITLLLLASHGNAAPSKADVVARMNASGLLSSVWNADPQEAFTRYPTLGEMRSARRTVLISSAYGACGVRSRLPARRALFVLRTPHAPPPPPHARIRAPPCCA